MTYDPKVPEIQESPKTSCVPIQENFLNFSTAFSNLITGVVHGHINLNDFNKGKHAAVMFQRQTIDPDVTLDLTTLYAKNAASAAGTHIQLFSRILKFLPTEQDTTDASNTPIQLTYDKVNTGGPQYQSFLPGGYILYFGSQTNIANSIALSPTPSEILSVMSMATDTRGISGTPAVDSSVEVTQPNIFKINSFFGASQTFLWLAIARA